MVQVHSSFCRMPIQTSSIVGHYYDILHHFIFSVKYYCSVSTGENEGRTKYSVADGMPSKRFRLVSEQKKTVEGDFRF